MLLTVLIVNARVSVWTTGKKVEWKIISASTKREKLWMKTFFQIFEKLLEKFRTTSKYFPRKFSLCLFIYKLKSRSINLERKLFPSRPPFFIAVRPHTSSLNQLKIAPRKNEKNSDSASTHLHNLFKKIPLNCDKRARKKITSRSGANVRKVDCCALYFIFRLSYFWVFYFGNKYEHL